MPRRNKSRSRKSKSREKAEPRRETQAEARAREAGLARRLAYLNLFWTDCPNKACRRVKNCAGAKPCFNARWLAMPEEQRQWRRDWLKELYRTRDFEQAAAFADARAEENRRRVNAALAHAPKAASDA